MVVEVVVRSSRLFNIDIDNGLAYLSLDEETNISFYKMTSRACCILCNTGRQVIIFCARPQTERSNSGVITAII